MDHPDIPKRHLPPAWIVRRWPELAALEDNPFFLLWRYRHGTRRGDLLSIARTLSGVGLMGLLLICASVASANPPLASFLESHALTLLVLYLGYLLLLKLALAIPRTGIANADVRALFRLPSQEVLQELRLTPLEHQTVVFGLLAPGISRMRLWQTAFLAASSMLLCGWLTVGHWGWPLIHAGAQCGALAVMWAVHLNRIDAYHLGRLGRRCAALALHRPLLTYALHARLALAPWTICGLLLLLRLCGGSANPAGRLEPPHFMSGYLVIFIILVYRLPNILSDARLAKMNLSNWRNHSRRIFTGNELGEMF